MRVVLYALMIGAAIKAFAVVWRYYWGIQTGRLEGGALAGAVIGFILILDAGKGPYIASGVAALIITGYFAGKLIKNNS